MVKIRISYEHDKELPQTIKRLGLNPKDWKEYKVSRVQEGKYKKAYVTLK